MLNVSSTLTIDNMAKLGIESEVVSQMSLMNERSYQELRNKHKEEREEGGIIRWHERKAFFYIKVEK